MMTLRIHGPTVPVITMEKKSYDESNHILTVSVHLEAGVKLTDYSFKINYKKVVPISYASGSPIDPNGNCEIPLDMNSCSCSAGKIILTSVTDNKETTRRSLICTMKFQLEEDLLEEELPNDLFEVEEGETIINNDDGTYEDPNIISDIVKIGTMPSTVESITLENPVFDYTTDTDGDLVNDSYKYGENINLIGGTATITYSNTKNTTRTARLNLDSTDGKYKWYEVEGGILTKILNITPISWRANIIGTKNVHVAYKEKTSNDIGVNVIDEIESITVTPKETYYYNDEFDYENTKVNIKWASKAAPEQKKLKELVDNSQATVSGFNSTAEEIKKSSVEQEITASFNYLGYTEDIKFNVTIKDIIDRITLTAPTKLKYKFGEEKLDLDNGTINVQWRSGEEKRYINSIEILEGSAPVKENPLLKGLRTAIELNDSIKITGFDSSECGTNTITLEYHYTDQDGVAKTKTGLTYDIKILDYIEGITLEPIKEYYYNDDFDYENSIVNIKWASKTNPDEKILKELIESGNATISGFNSTADEIKKSLDGVKQNVTVIFDYDEELDEIYEDYTKTTDPFEVTIKDKIEEVTFEEGTIKKDYEYQEPSLDLTGGTIDIKWLSEATEERPLNNIEIKAGSSSIINNSIVPSHLNDSILVTGFDSTQYGSQLITIEYYYAGKATPEVFTYNIKINLGIKSIDLNKNEISIPYGQLITDEYLKENDIKVIITNTDDTQRDPIPVKADWIGEYNKTKEKIGEKQTTYVDYNGTKIPFYITVENCLDHIELTKNIITVKWGQELNFTDEYKVIPVMANGTKEEGILFTNDKVQIEGSYDLRDVGTYKVKVTYEGKKADFTIIVVDPIIEVRLDEEEKAKIQKEYKYNEELNLNGAQLTIVRESGTYKETISKNWTDYDKEKLGIQKITINYKDDETQEVFTLEECFEVEVKDYIVDIVLVKPNKTTYLPKEKLDLTGATVRTLSASGKLGDEVAVTEEMISGYEEGILGTQRITVKYSGFEKTFDAIFTAQTGVAYSNVYTILITIIATSTLTIIAMLTIIKKRRRT